MSSFAADLIKLIGKNDEEQEVTQWLDSGVPELNLALSGRYDGGFGYGRLYEIYGPSMCGKTAMATELMIAAQKAGGAVIFIDYERAFDVGMAKARGLDTTFGKWIYRRPDTWEQGNTHAMRAAQYIREKGAESGEVDKDAPILIVQDSIAAAIPKSMLYDSKGKRKELDELSMNDTTALARVTSTTLKVVAQLAADLNVTVIYINQIRTKLGVMFGDPTTTPGGNAMEFYASGRLALGKKMTMVEEGGEKVLGSQEISAKAVKTKHTRPFSTAKMTLTFDADGMVRFDYPATFVEWLLRKKVLETSGSYVLFGGKKLFKSQLVEAAEKDARVLDALKRLAREKIGHEATSEKELETAEVAEAA